jgi:hypothetical protein
MHQATHSEIAASQDNPICLCQLTTIEDSLASIHRPIAGLFLCRFVFMAVEIGVVISPLTGVRLVLCSWSAGLGCVAVWPLRVR